MRFKNISLPMILLLCLATAVQAAPQKIMTPEADPLGTGSWERIVSTEHTAEYLAKTGGLAQGDYLATAVNVAGNWSFELTDQKSRPAGKIDLRLFQTGSVLFGTGLFKSGLSSTHVTANGYLADGNAMVLGVVSYENSNLYQLFVDSSTSGTAGGSFRAFSPAGGEPLQGTIFGGRNEPRTFSPFGS